MEFTKGTCEEFVEVLASKAPVPGGGGASALVGAIGTALGNMVGSLTLGKKKYADVQDDIIALKAKADALQAELLGLVQKDAEMFEPLSKAYGLPKETEEEKAEQLKLRGEYINAYKQSLIAQLENTYILEPDGTKRKVRRKDDAAPLN